MNTSVVDKLDVWRREAYDYSSSSDRMGIVISRAMELLLVVVKHGAGAENLKYAVDSLKWERSIAQHPAKDGKGTLREHVFRLCEALELSMESVIDRRGSDFKEEEPVLPFVAPSARDSPAGSVLPVDTMMVSPLMATTLSTSQANKGIPGCNPVKEEVEVTGIPVASSSLAGHISTYTSNGVFEMDGVEIKEEDILAKDSDFVYRDDGSWEAVETGNFSNAHSEEGLEEGQNANEDDDYQMNDEEEEEEEVEEKKPKPAKRKFTNSGQNACELCGATFVRSRDLKRHMKTIDHSVYRPRKMHPDRLRKFKCDLCPAEYTRVDNLTRHKAWHEGKRQMVKCTHCDMMLMDNLKGHLREVHGIDPYPCKKCGQAFSRLELLKTHWTDCFERGDQFKNKVYE